MSITTSDLLGFIRTGILALDQQAKTGEPTTKFREDLIGLQRAVQDFSQQQSAILCDVSLSESGKRNRLQTAAQTKANELDWWWRKPSELAAVEERLKNLLYASAKRPAGDPVLQYLREKELRDDLKGKTKTEIDGVFYQAVADGKAELLRALLHGPGGPMPSEAARQQVAEQQARQSNPAEFETLRDLKEIQQLLGLMVERSARWLLELGADFNKSNVVKRVA